MTSTISASAERELERRAKHKLAVLRHVEEVSGSVAATCRYFGITRTAYYMWRKRYEEEGFEGLKDRSSVPHRSPNATSAEVVEKIRWLRQQYHFGPHKIAMYLKRYHGITISPSGSLAHPEQARDEPTASLSALQAQGDPVEALREAAPGPPAAGRREVHRAVGASRPEERYYQYTAIDDCTRLRVLRAYPSHDQKTAIVRPCRSAWVWPV